MEQNFQLRCCEGVQYVGNEARTIEEEVGSSRVLESRFVYTSDDGTKVSLLAINLYHLCA